ncbi:hypothetical protein GCM10010171_51870 [Actinokineospora fastidiosa]|uniref:Uncharacterized protein n=1 Tax=Actinokineospora fastidiosa TaxID=1816 RepID=A0A918LI12_9PSEU|nr:hypothetical protein GCM10010171_51870 [Actinokineospora fastidiosa]
MTRPQAISRSCGNANSPNRSPISGPHSFHRTDPAPGFPNGGTPAGPGTSAEGGANVSPPRTTMAGLLDGPAVHETVNAATITQATRRLKHPPPDTAATLPSPR